jgi:hypothetical protein
MAEAERTGNARWRHFPCSLWRTCLFENHESKFCGNASSARLSTGSPAAAGASTSGRGNAWRGPPGGESEGHTNGGLFGQPTLFAELQSSRLFAELQSSSNSRLRTLMLSTEAFEL